MNPINELMFSAELTEVICTVLIMALPKRPTSLKSNISSGKIREWTTIQVAQWMKDVNNGLFAKYVDTVILLKLNGTDLMNLTQNDMKTKLGITIPNHMTTLSAAIERLKKKSRRRNKKDRSPNSRSPMSTSGKSKPNFDIMDTIPNYKKDNTNENANDIETIRPLQSSTSKQRLNNTYVDDIKTHDKITRAQTSTVQHNSKTLNGQKKQISDTVTLKKKITQAHLANKKKDKYLYKDLGKKLWPKETSVIMKEGWMKKRGVRRSGFKERWCVLRDNGHLYYFEKRPAVNSDLPQGMLDLDIVNSIEYMENEDPNTFNIKTKNRDWIFSAMSGGQLVEWMSALNKTFKAIHQ